MALKAVNDSICLHRLAPTLLVYGVYPRMTRDSAPAPLVTARAEKIEKAMKKLYKIQAQRSVSSVPATRNSSNTLAVLNLPLQTEIIVWKENKSWKEPFNLLAIDIDQQECKIDMPYGPNKFRATVVEP